MNKNKRLLTVKEVSEILSIKEKTLYQWAELGQIPHIKLNKLIRFDFEAILNWIKECEKDTESRYNCSIQSGSPVKEVRK